MDFKLILTLAIALSSPRCSIGQAAKNETAPVGSGGSSAGGSAGGSGSGGGGGGDLEARDGGRVSLPEARQRQSQCGVRRSTAPDAILRIVGGSTAASHEFPWQLSLVWRWGGSGHVICGATLLNPRWAATAAHCTRQHRRSELMLLAGDHVRELPEGTEQERFIQAVYEHERYNARTQENDIAMLKVTRRFDIDGRNLLPACLPSATNYATDCLVTGWGSLSEGGPKATRLQKVVVPLMSQAECERRYQAVGYYGPIGDGMLCAGWPQGRRDACQGDSGGPLVCRGAANRYVLAGVVSWGIGCARRGVPGVYTRVSHYTAWMQRVVNGQQAVGIRRAGQEAFLHLDDLLQEDPANGTDPSKPFLSDPFLGDTDSEDPLLTEEDSLAFNDTILYS